MPEVTDTPERAPDADDLRRVQRLTRERYGARLQAHGVSARALGWGSREHQETRFAVASSLCDFTGKRVLDYGCGFADLLGHLQARGATPAEFTGVDLNPEFVEVARGRYPEARFFANDLAAEDEASWSADVVVMLGLLNYRQPELDNFAFARRMLRLAFAWARECVICDFHSDVSIPEYPREDWINYYPPARILELGLSLTPLVSLRHDYACLPQREMLLVLRREAVRA